MARSDMAVAPKAHDPMSFFGATRGPLDATRGNGGEGEKNNQMG